MTRLGVSVVIGGLMAGMAAAAGCGSKQPAPDLAVEAGATVDAGAESAPECTLDGDCDDNRFCDRGQCATPVDEFKYGTQCTPAPILPEGLRDGKFHMCGAYLCIDGRCRSCISDEECQIELGSPVCVPRPPRPGRRCGAAL
jgi:hypothetical protein